MAAWWLGEHANVATDEYAGSSGIASSPAEDDVLATSGFGRVVINTENKHLSAGEVYLSATCRRTLMLHDTKNSCNADLVFITAGYRASGERKSSYDGCRESVAARHYDDALANSLRSCTGNCKGADVTLPPSMP